MARFLAAAALCLVPVLVAAQEALPSAALQMGLPSASLDRRPPVTSASRDLFRASASTYAPGFDQPPAVDPRLLCCSGSVGPVFATAAPWWAAAPQVVYVPVIVRETPTPPAPPAPPAASPPPAPGPPKTFYVIPRCYAGDRPPEADALPAGCDIRRLRTIPPR